ncbi:MAG: hypothetical protein KAJ15_06590, partial [Spirochaetes bacterium]|nr:hypothetical protein [Spirochaetota bacterium]
MIVFISVIFIGLIFIFVGLFFQSSKYEKKYDRALKSFKAEEYKEALELFQELLGKETTNKL